MGKRSQGRRVRRTRPALEYFSFCPFPLFFGQLFFYLVDKGCRELLWIGFYLVRGSIKALLSVRAAGSRCHGPSYCMPRGGGGQPGAALGVLSP